MKRLIRCRLILTGIVLAIFVIGNIGAAAERKLPAPASGKVDFARDIKPILQKACVECHGNNKRNGGLNLDHPHTLMAGGESGPAVIKGDSAKSPLIVAVLGNNDETAMPQDGELLSLKEVALLRAWIDQGLTWEPGFTFAKYRQAPLAPRRVKLPPASHGNTHAIDRLLQPYYDQHKIANLQPTDDRTFARRVYLDLVGLLPPANELQTFVADGDPDKRAKLVDRLLADRRGYTEHWLTFWSDVLRNSYRGAGYIDNGRKQITGWLYGSLYENKPYDRMVRELVGGTNGAEGFAKGIKWRGTVNDSQRREMQAAQNVAQIFLGTNLKCASCHHSFVNQWRLDDAYALASVFAPRPLEIHRCNKPTGKISGVRFLYPQLGKIDAKAPVQVRMKQLGGLLTNEKNGRLARTMVNRLWANFFGRGLVEPLDDMDQETWNGDLLDWLAVDLAEHGYNLKHTMRRIVTSRAYQLQAVGAPLPENDEFIFRGPLVRRMSAEQFIDAVSTTTGVWPAVTGAMKKIDGRQQGGQWATIAAILGKQTGPAQLRAVLLDEDALLRAMGRPSREQVVTRRESIATTLEALELTNGSILDRRLKQGTQRWLKQSAGKKPGKLIEQIYQTALGRAPSGEEQSIAAQLIGATPSQQGVEDLLWALTMLPEFQLIY